MEILNIHGSDGDPHRPLLALAVLHPRKLVVYRVSVNLECFARRCCAIVDGLCYTHGVLRQSVFTHQVEAKGGVGTNAKYHELVRAYEHKLGVRGLHFTVRCATV